MKYPAFLFSILAGMILSGCGSSTIEFSQPGVSDEQRRADFADCEFQIQINAGLLTNREYVDRLALCLEGKGYTTNIS